MYYAAKNYDKTLGLLDVCVYCGAEVKDPPVERVQGKKTRPQCAWCRERERERPLVVFGQSTRGAFGSATAKDAAKAAAKAAAVKARLIAGGG